MRIVGLGYENAGLGLRTVGLSHENQLLMLEIMTAVIRSWPA